MIWLTLALAQTLVSAVSTDLNRGAQQDPQALNRWQATLGLSVWLALSPWATWPATPGFYALAALNGLASIGCNVILLSLSRSNNSRVASLYVPLSALTAFVTWLACVPPARTALFAQPHTVVILALAFGLFTTGFLRLRRSAAGWTAFLAVIPVGLTWGTLDTAIKLTLPSAPDLHVVVAYITVHTLFLALGSWLLALHRREAVRPNAPLLRTAARGTALNAVSFLLFILALQAAPNPAYPALIGMSLPLWIFAWHRLRGVDDPLRPSTLLLFIAGGLAALLATL